MSQADLTNTWDNAALMSPATAAQARSVTRGKYAHGSEHSGFFMPVASSPQVGESKVEAPVWIVPGQADGSITVHLGYGRQFAGHNPAAILSIRLGLMFTPFRTSENPWFASGLRHPQDGRHLPARLHAGKSIDAEPRSGPRLTLHEYHDRPHLRGGTRTGWNVRRIAVDANR